MSRLIIVTAPSGSGKTTIVRHLIEKFDFLAFSVSVTTRPPRSYEKDGIDYYFIDIEAFKKKVAAGEFLEWEEVYENRFYGTLKSEVERLWGLQKSVIFDVDVKGALNIKKKYPDSSLSIFIKPPSLKVLEQRLRNRETETPDTIKIRLTRAKEEIHFQQFFDKVIVNDDLQKALATAEAVIRDFFEI